MDAALAPLRRQGVRIASYLDDWPICAPSERQARSDTEVVLAHLRRLGLASNRKKKKKKLPYSFKDGNLSRLGVGFEWDESLLDPQEALSVERTLSRFSVMKQVTVKFGSHPGGAIGAAPHAPATAVVCPAQSEPLGGWPAASPLGARLPGSRDMVAYDSGPSGGCSHGSGMFQSHNIYRRLHEGLGRSVPGLVSPGSVEALLERGSCEPTRVRGSASGVDVLSASVPGEAGPHQDRQFCGGFLYQPPGGYALSGASQRSLQASFVGAGSRSLLESGVPARERLCGSRSSVQGRPPSRGMAAPPSHRAGHLGPFRPGSGGPLCLPGDYSLPLVVFHDRPQGHIGGGCPSVHMAPGPSVRFPPFPLLPAMLARVRMLQARVLLVAPDWPHQPWRAELVTMLVEIP